MKQLLILTFLVLSVISCDKTTIEASRNTTNLNIYVKATFGEEPLIINQKSYDYLDNSIRFSKISFYLANLALVNEEKEIKISEIEFIELTSTHSVQSLEEKGTAIKFSGIPLGNYTDLSFDIGVPSYMNKKTPADYPSTHPLGFVNNELYSEEMEGYIFARIEGVYNINGEDVDFEYHAGIERDYQEEIILNEINVKQDNENAIGINLTLDIKQLFKSHRELLFSIENYNNSDKPNYRNLVIRIMDNFKKALELK